MRAVITSLFLATLVSGVVAGSHAAPALPADVCQIKGKVLSMRTRNEGAVDVNQDASRRQVTYTDILIRVDERKVHKQEKNSFGEGCIPFRGSQLMTYQLKAGENPPQIGSVITALTHFAGDERVHGDWIYNIKLAY